jgi:adenylate kinase family enzyme
MVFGRPGSGKSTFSVQLGEDLSLPVYHLDRYFFKEKWVPQEQEVFLHIQQGLVAQEKWIIDGNALSSLGMRYARAHVALYFSYPRLLCLWRLFKRLFHRDKRIQDRAEGCPEQVRWPLIKYMWGFEERVAPALGKLRQDYPHVQFYKIKNNKDLKDILKKGIFETP